MRTQMFTKFIEERSFVSDTNASLAFFDECMDRQTDHYGTDPVRFLEIEGSISDRTVFILPPDASDLPPGGIYKYKQFDDLNPGNTITTIEVKTVGIHILDMDQFQYSSDY